MVVELPESAFEFPPPTVPATEAEGSNEAQYATVTDPAVIALLRGKEQHMQRAERRSGGWVRLTYSTDVASESNTVNRMLRSMLLRKAREALLTTNHSNDSEAHHQHQRTARVARPTTWGHHQGK